MLDSLLPLDQADTGTPVNEPPTDDRTSLICRWLVDPDGALVMRWSARSINDAEGA